MMPDLADPMDWTLVVALAHTRVALAVQSSRAVLHESRETLRQSDARLNQSGLTLAAGRALAAAAIREQPRAGASLMALGVGGLEDRTAGDHERVARQVAMQSSRDDLPAASGAAPRRTALGAPSSPFGLMALIAQVARIPPPGDSKIVPFPGR